MGTELHVRGPDLTYSDEFTTLEIVIMNQLLGSEFPFLLIFKM